MLQSFILCCWELSWALAGIPSAASMATATRYFLIDFSSQSSDTVVCLSTDRHYMIADPLRKAGKPGTPIQGDKGSDVESRSMIGGRKFRYKWGQHSGKLNPFG